MKNYSKEFRGEKLWITVGTHWHDWALPLRIYWDEAYVEIFIDIFCFTLVIEIF